MTETQGKKVVEVTFASPSVQKLLSVELQAEGTAMDAIMASHILEQCPEIDLNVNKVGVFGKAIRKPEDHVLRPGDRVEIYRPLPKKNKKIIADS
jgi:putative ubiquitin-RnfH superfamily antitoxin RatB of RatAB toxin-antitoxin module